MNGGRGSLPASVGEVLKTQAEKIGSHTAFTFLTDGETQEEKITYQELETEARRVGSKLQSLAPKGHRVLLLYPPGLDYIKALFGCLYAGMIAVPLYPPDPAKINQTLPRMLKTAADAQTDLALTNRKVLEMAGPLLGAFPELQNLNWVPSDEIEPSQGGRWDEPAMQWEDLALLMYTSGSTGEPKGVMISHGNLVHSLNLIKPVEPIKPEDKGVGWGPPYHISGLAFGILLPHYLGFEVVLMSPLDFLEKPIRWLAGMSRYKASFSATPNFAFDLCVDNISAKEKKTLDLSHWKHVMIGAEPIRAQTLERFAKAFEPCGFRREVFMPVFGTTETTVLVSRNEENIPPLIDYVDRKAIETHRVIKTEPNDPNSRPLVECGKILDETKIKIVNPESCLPCNEDEIGEIWVAGGVVTKGYWKKPEETAQIFEAHLADSGEGPYLRTGDLGYLKDDRIFITGRYKDMIIIRGLNYYPQDIEMTVEKTHPSLRAGSGAAFSIEKDNQEQLVVLQELNSVKPDKWESICEEIRRAISNTHYLHAYSIVLLEPDTLPRTASRKIQRHACRREYLKGSLKGLFESKIEDASSSSMPIQAKKESAKITRKELMEWTAEKRLSHLESYLQEQIAGTMKKNPSEIKPETTIASLGLDSLLALQLRIQIENEIGVSVPLSNLLQGPSIKKLAGQIQNHLSSGADIPMEEINPVLAQQILENFDGLSDQEVDQLLNKMSPKKEAP